MRRSILSSHASNRLMAATSFSPSRRSCASRILAGSARLSYFDQNIERIDVLGVVIAEARRSVKCPME